MGNNFATFFKTGDDISTSDFTPSTVDDPVEYIFFQYVDAFSWEANISGIKEEHNQSNVCDLKRSMVTNTFVNPPGFSHQVAGSARLSE